MKIGLYTLYTPRLYFPYLANTVRYNQANTTGTIRTLVVFPVLGEGGEGFAALGGDGGDVVPGGGGRPLPLHHLGQQGELGGQ